ncbi:uncharacterized protein VP01_1877g5 [Puccinia sorghi]|uniref:Reverse transcriptase Ty1/copia-type domain-containing protein n=1 Tax=Puccinia sorghi TaxID=27349 RepID=A0A0L6VD69_9BASI|nr:uncharacterized protein VP01_1877g5 [Puccinia sorghi]
MMLLYSLHQNLNITQFETPKGVNHDIPYLKLNKALYGLKQAPKNWYETLVSWLESIGFQEYNCDPCLYLCNDNVSRIVFHVDDLVLNSSCHEPNTILGMKIEKVGHKILLSQQKHIKHGLDELGLTECKISQTLLTPNLKLTEASDEENQFFKKENISYRSEIGLMNYLNSPLSLEYSIGMKFTKFGNTSRVQQI